mmetsp:Transcript_34050/g.78526  ORF Transcript_34050/g.78526 Transcript_34050/m.78526 type:complete len:80 (+) Transcript_34050:179-418(+)
MHAACEGEVAKVESRITERAVEAVFMFLFVPEMGENWQEGVYQRWRVFAQTFKHCKTKFIMMRVSYLVLCLLLFVTSKL